MDLGDGQRAYSRTIDELVNRLRVSVLVDLVLSYWQYWPPEYVPFPESGVDWYYALHITIPPDPRSRRGERRLSWVKGGAERVMTLDRSLQTLTAADVGRIGSTLYAGHREAGRLFVVVWVHDSGRWFGVVYLDTCKFPLRDGGTGPFELLIGKDLDRGPTGDPRRPKTVWVDSRPVQEGRYRVHLLATWKTFPRHCRDLGFPHDYLIQEVVLFKRQPAGAECRVRLTFDQEEPVYRDDPLVQAPASNLLTADEAACLERQWRLDLSVRHKRYKTRLAQKRAVARGKISAPILRPGAWFASV